MNLRIPGPIPVPDDILDVMSSPMINHRGSDFKDILYRVTSNLKQIFETGTSIAERRRYGDARIIAAGHPVWLEDEVIGSILIKQSGNKILSLQSDTLRRFTLLFLGVFLFLTLTILVFAFRLTYRVTRPLGLKMLDWLEAVDRR